MIPLYSSAIPSPQPSQIQPTICDPYRTFVLFAIRLQLQQIRHISQHWEADHWNTSKADTWKAPAKWVLGTGYLQKSTLREVQKR